MSNVSIKIHIFDKAKYESYEDARSENAIHIYDASHCDDQLESNFGGGLLYETIDAMLTALGMFGYEDRLGAVLLINDSIVDRW